MEKQTFLRIKFLNKLDYYLKAVKEYEEFCSCDLKRNIEIAGIIQGFEFTFELAWKMLNVLCELKGVDIAGPRDTLKAAFSLRIIENGPLWLAMLEDRNSTTHRYDEEFGLNLVLKLRSDYRSAFVKLKHTAESFRDVT